MLRSTQTNASTTIGEYLETSLYKGGYDLCQSGIRVRGERNQSSINFLNWSVTAGGGSVFLLIIHDMSYQCAHRCHTAILWPTVFGRLGDIVTRTTYSGVMIHLSTIITQLAPCETCHLTIRSAWYTRGDHYHIHNRQPGGGEYQISVGHPSAWVVAEKVMKVRSSSSHKLMSMLLLHQLHQSALTGHVRQPQMPHNAWSHHQASGTTWPLQACPSGDYH